MQSQKAALKHVLQATPLNAILEQRSMRRWYDYKQKHAPSVRQALDAIQTRWPIQLETDDENPIFILASGWRSGSTLLQRIVNSDDTIMLWGEPFPDSNFVQNMAESLRPFQGNYPPDYNFLQSDNFAENDTPLSRRWIANLYPNFEDFYHAHREFFIRLYGTPARQQQCDRWGFKEVRLTVEHALYLKWLFPNAKFLFLYRNPYDAYRSCYNWRNLYMHWPDEEVCSPEQFGFCWVKQVTGFLNSYQNVDGYLIKYEGLCSQKEPISNIASYLNASLKDDILEGRIGSSNDQKFPPGYLLKRLEKIVAPVAKPLGYYPPIKQS